MNERPRNFCFDNIKGLLILLVVFGHLLELVPGSAALWIYRIIYSFHMPVFVFCSGRFARFSANRLFSKLLYPYLVYQTLYLLFARMIFHHNAAFQYTTPYWLLWYLFSMIFWLVLLPLIRRIPCRFVLPASLVLALAAGFSSAGYFLGLSRTLVFFPFFIFGYFSAPFTQYLESLSAQNKFRLRLTLFALVTTFSAALWFGQNRIHSNWFYESLSYQQCGSNLLIRAVLLLIGFLWTALLLTCMSTHPIPFLARLGVYTMPIFLLHGFFVKLFGQLHVLSNAPFFGIPAAALLALALCLLLGNATVQHWFGITFSAEWLLRIKDKLLKHAAP